MIRIATPIVPKKLSGGFPKWKKKLTLDNVSSGYGLKVGGGRRGRAG